MDSIFSFRQQLKDAKDLLAAFVEQKDRLQKYKTGPAPPSPPLTDFEKLDPCATRKQHRMKVFLHHLGVIGLWHAIYVNAKQAEYEERTNKDLNKGIVNESWQVLMDDYRLGSQSRTLYYLMSIPEEVLMALVEGNLPSRMQEAGFRSKYTSFLALKHNQGVYACYVGVAHQDVDSQSTLPTPSLTGYGLNLEELKEVVDTMHTYCDNDEKDGRDDPEQARLIDTRFRTTASYTIKDYQDGYRRYAGKGDAPSARMYNFINASYDNYDLLSNGGNQNLNQLRLQRCFCYVGLGIKVANRAPQHHGHIGEESPLWGLFTATCKALFETRFSNSEFTYQVIQTTREADIGLDEILVSVLASAYAFDGGLSASHAGKQKGAKGKRDAAYAEELKESAKLYRQRGHQEKNMTQSFLKFSEAEGVITLKSDNGKMQQELEARLEELKVKTEEAIQFYGDLVAVLNLQIMKSAVKALKA